MKKATILMALVLLLSVCGVGVLAADIYQARDQVVLTEQVVYGDRTRAYGLNVQIDSNYRSHLFWNTSLALHETSGVKTDYQFFSTQYRETYPAEREGINIRNNVLDSLDMQMDEGTPQEGIYVAYQELYDETEPGQDGRKDILLKDYITHYPIGFVLDFPNNRFNSDRIDRDLRRQSDTVSESEVYIVQKLREYFRIPVLENEHLEIHISKRTDGTQGSWGGGTSQYGDWYNLWSYSVLSNEACYFTFDTLTNKGKTIDTSELPEGYGIYRLPYHIERDEQQRMVDSVIDVDHLEMVYPLTPGIEIAYLSLNTEQNCLYLHAVENGIYTITVIDISTMEAKQTLEVVQFKDEHSWGISDQEDFMVIDLYPSRELAVISKGEGGELTLEYICPVHPEDVHSFYSYNAAMDFDGERLVLAQQLDIEYDHEPDYRDRKSCGILIAVYEKDGLTYLGEYKSSLDTGEDWSDHAFYVQGNYYEPVAAAWADCS